MVDDTDGLAWNPALVDAKVLGLSFTTSNRTATDVSATKK
jgi:hypothetical protein